LGIRSVVENLAKGGSQHLQLTGVELFSQWISFLRLHQFLFLNTSLRNTHSGPANG
jgi:hypothetical protein